MKDEIIRGYYDEEGDFIKKKMPPNRVKCYWSSDGVDCKNIAIKGYWFCKEHNLTIHKINGRKFKVHPDLENVFVKDE